MKKSLAIRKSAVAKVRRAGLSDGTRMLICRMAMCGLSNKAIKASCGVTEYQIYQAQKWGNVKKIDYRDALNPIGKHVQNKCEELSDNVQLKHLERLLLK